MLCASNMFGVVVSAILLSTLTGAQGRYVRHLQMHRSVVQHKVIPSWDEAKRRCEAEDAVAKLPLNEEMLEYIKWSLGINNDTTPYFIGDRMTGTPELIFASEEGVPLDDVPEDAMNMIEQVDPQDGDCLAMGRHNIRVVSCRVRFPYICYKNDTSTSTTVTPVDVTTDSKPEVTPQTDNHCSEGYTYLSGSYYKLHNASESLPWDEAQLKCSSEGGYLIVINDANEAQIIKNFAFIENESWDWIFIGIRDRDKNGNWRSVLQNPLDEIYHKWSIGRIGSYDCGSIDWDGELDDMDCSWKLPFICEKQC